MQPARDSKSGGVKDAFSVLMGAAGRRADNQQQQHKRARSATASPVLKRQRADQQASSVSTLASVQQQQQLSEQYTPQAAAQPAPSIGSSQPVQSKDAAVEAFKRAFSGSKRPKAQLFDYLLVYDLEATTNKARTLHPVEIIELSCIIVQTATASITASFQSFVRPTEHPQLDAFVTELCGITQQQVDQAPLLADVLQQHYAWLHEQGVLHESVSCVPVTWTAWDLKVALCTECGWRRIQRPTFLCRWVDLKPAFKAVYKKAGNLKACVEAAGLTWQGREHSGLDDATNTANLAIHLMHRGVQFEVTQVSENPPIRQQQQGLTGGAPALQPASDHGLAAPGIAAAAAAAGEAGPSPGNAAVGLSGSSPARRGSMAQLAKTKGVSGVYDSSGRWLGRCLCGVKAKQRTTKRPGPNHGRQFWSCGRWTITKQQSSACEFFLWADEVPGGSSPG